MKRSSTDCAITAIGKHFSSLPSYAANSVPGRDLALAGRPPVAMRNRLARPRPETARRRRTTPENPSEKACKKPGLPPNHPRIIVQTHQMLMKFNPGKTLYPEMLRRLALDGRWRDVELCGFVGLKGERYKGELLVVGRAVNTWGNEWTAVQMLEETFIEEKIDEWAELNAMTWVSE